MNYYSNMCIPNNCPYVLRGSHKENLSYCSSCRDEETCKVKTDDPICHECSEKRVCCSYRDDTDQISHKFEQFCSICELKFYCYTRAE